MNIALESPNQPDVVALIGELDAYQDSLYPPEARYALDLAALCRPNVAFAVARDASGAAMGCGAVMLEGAARAQGCRELLLETGPYQPEALAFYARQGFERRGPFAGYPDHPLSVFMGKALDMAPR